MRFYGAVGFATSAETVPGVWAETIVERPYFGTVVQNSRHQAQPSQTPPVVHGDILLENSFSIMADAEAYEKYLQIRYVRWENANWEVTNVRVERPRLILTVGGLWRGNTA
jgi:hypothetical protein